MHQRPEPAELLEAVAAFLREQAMPQLPGHAAFLARVSANALDIARRQLLLAPAADAAELQRLRALLQQDGTLAQLNALLCERIAEGQVGLHTPGLAEHLWQTTLDKLAVDQPGYESYRRETAATNRGTER
jgi:Domain of unknown function (DUF6285)